MYRRIDQQLRVTRTMIDAVDLPDAVPEKKLEHYMENYLSMMMCICSDVPAHAQEGRGRGETARHLALS